MTEHTHDPKLWVRLASCCAAKHFLCDTADTFRGRMLAYCPTNNSGIAFSLSEIESMSKEARHWIDGFLCGNQPPRPRDTEGDLIDTGRPEYKKWETAVAEFRKTGIWNPA